MKKIMRIAGIVMEIGGILLFLCGVIAQEELKPVRVETGYAIDGVYTPVHSGYMGGSFEAQEKMEPLKVIGIFAAITGVVAIVTSRYLDDY